MEFLKPIPVAHVYICYHLSRSQCIINIRCAAEDTEGESEAVLTFVDLAGAEREKKTGNKVSCVILELNIMMKEYLGS